MYALIKEKKFKEVVVSIDSNPKSILDEYKLQAFGRVTLLHLGVLCKAPRFVFEKIITTINDNSKIQMTEEEKKEWINRKSSVSGKTVLHLIMEYCVLLVKKDMVPKKSQKPSDETTNPIPVVISEEWKSILQYFKLSNLFNFNELDSHGRSILHYVCMKQNYPIGWILYLVNEFGCDPFMLTESGENIFHLCCVKDRYNTLTKLILLFWVETAPNESTSKNHTSETSPETSPETITTTVDLHPKRVYLDQPNKKGYTPFHFACSFAALHSVERLISFGCNVFGVARNKTLDTGLSLVLKLNNSSLLSLLTMKINTIHALTPQGAGLLEKLQNLEKLVTQTHKLPKLTQTETACFLKLARMVRMFGYPFEIHEVMTEDGYILHVMHIPHGRKENQVSDVFATSEESTDSSQESKHVVFLQHGVLNSGAAWLACGPYNGLGFLLADAGCDVWLGNNRGVQFSRSHKTLTDGDKKFWDFTFHEMGIYDLPAQINYVHSNSKYIKNSSNSSQISTNSEAITYIGHSQGCTQAFIGFSLLNPEFQKKISLMCGLAPVSTLQNQQNPFYGFLGTSLFKPDAFLSLIPGFSSGTEFVAGNSQISRTLLPKISLFKPINNNLNFLFNFFMNGHISKNVYPLLTQHEISPTSTKNMMHWVQLLRHGNFMAFDYGSNKKNNEFYFNLNKKGKEIVDSDKNGNTSNDIVDSSSKNSRLNPNFTYPIENIKIPISLFYGDKDDLASPGDVEKYLVPKLGKYCVFHKLEKGLLHNDFVWGCSEGYEISHRLFPEILRQIQAVVKDFRNHDTESQEPISPNEDTTAFNEKLNLNEKEETNENSNEEEEKNENENLSEKEGKDDEMKEEKAGTEIDFLIEKKNFLS